jgi:hypothetical protein
MSANAMLRGLICAFYRDLALSAVMTGRNYDAAE